MTDEAKVKSRLDIEIICGHLSNKSLQLLGRLEVLESVLSTNDHVLALAGESHQQFVACIANQQLSGKGRNGRKWESPSNANIYMTVGCYFSQFPACELGGLSLACGVSVANILHEMGLKPQLKWPNDILLGGKKLAGVLIETRIRSNAIFVVIGLGMNVNMPATSAEKINQPWVDLQSVLAESVDCIERNKLLAQLLDALIDCCVKYRQSGFKLFAGDWGRFDMLSGQQVIVKTGTKKRLAKVLGIDANYALRVEIGGVEEILYAADIKLKLEGNANN